MFKLWLWVWAPSVVNLIMFCCLCGPPTIVWPCLCEKKNTDRFWLFCTFFCQGWGHRCMLTFKINTVCTLPQPVVVTSLWGWSLDLISPPTVHRNERVMRNDNVIMSFSCYVLRHRHDMWIFYCIPVMLVFLLLLSPCPQSVSNPLTSWSPLKHCVINLSYSCADKHVGASLQFTINYTPLHKRHI